MAEENQNFDDNNNKLDSILQTIKEIKEDTAQSSATTCNTTFTKKVDNIGKGLGALSKAIEGIYSESKTQTQKIVTTQKTIVTTQIAIRKNTAQINKTLTDIKGILSSKNFSISTSSNIKGVSKATSNVKQVEDVLVKLTEAQKKFYKNYYKQLSTASQPKNTYLATKDFDNRQPGFYLSKKGQAVLADYKTKKFLSTQTIPTIDSAGSLSLYGTMSNREWKKQQAQLAKEEEHRKRREFKDYTKTIQTNPKNQFLADIGTKPLAQRLAEYKERKSLMSYFTIPTISSVVPNSPLNAYGLITKEQEKLQVQLQKQEEKQNKKQLKNWYKNYQNAQVHGGHVDTPQQELLNRINSKQSNHFINNATQEKQRYQNIQNQILSTLGNIYGSLPLPPETINFRKHTTNANRLYKKDEQYLFTVRRRMRDLRAQGREDEARAYETHPRYQTLLQSEKRKYNFDEIGQRIHGDNWNSIKNNPSQRFLRFQDTFSRATGGGLTDVLTSKGRSKLTSGFLKNTGKGALSALGSGGFSGMAQFLLKGMTPWGLALTGLGAVVGTVLAPAVKEINEGVNALVNHAGLMAMIAIAQKMKAFEGKGKKPEYNKVNKMGKADIERGQTGDGYNPSNPNNQNSTKPMPSDISKLKSTKVNGVDAVDAKDLGLSGKKGVKIAKKNAETAQALSKWAESQGLRADFTEGIANGHQKAKSKGSNAHGDGNKVDVKFYDPKQKKYITLSDKQKAELQQMGFMGKGAVGEELGAVNGKKRSKWRSDSGSDTVYDLSISHRADNVPAWTQYKDKKAKEEREAIAKKEIEKAQSNLTNKEKKDIEKSGILKDTIASANIDDVTGNNIFDNSLIGRANIIGSIA